MNTSRFLQQIKQKEQLAILLDPDKLQVDEIAKVIKDVPTQANFLLIGGSFVSKGKTDIIVKEVKKHTTLPLILFPGDHEQLSNHADAILFLSLLSGKNAAFLIGHQLKAAPEIKKAKLSVIPTGYILIDGGDHSSVAQKSRTRPMDPSDIEKIVNTAITAEYLGKQLIYLEAGSGAKTPVNPKVIQEVSKNVDLSIIVGGGLRSRTQIEAAYQAGADVIVIGTAFENKKLVL
jgi:putative glycerol-1-phosphate prenyltransferase